MDELLSTVDWSRAQFALTAIIHWIFVPLSIGLSLIVGIMESIYYKTGNERGKRIAKFWMLLFGINFACGVATGIMKAHDAAIAVARSRPLAFILRVSAAAAMRGIIVAASAVLEVTSVAKVTRAATPAIMDASPNPASEAA